MIFFILGFVFAVTFYPILDGLTAVILSWFEVLKGKMAITIATYQNKVVKLQAPPPTRTIGFSDQSIEEPEEGWDDEE